MKRIKRILDINNLPQMAYSETSKTRNGEPTEHDKIFINILFVELAGIFPAWKSAFDGADSVFSAKRNWLDGLLESGIDNIELVQKGLKKSRHSSSPFMPSVGQFIQWCKPDYSELGILSAESAWLEVLECKGDFSHGIIFSIRKDSRINIFDWRLLRMDKAMVLFKPIYQEYVNRLINGEVFELPKTAIEDKVGKAVTKKEKNKAAKKALEKLKEKLKAGKK